MKIKKAQSSLEFVILAGFMLLFMIVFFAIIQDKISEKKFEERNALFNNMIYSVQNEINLAWKSSDGYSRRFEIPGQLGGLNYNLSIIDGLLYIKSEDGRYSASAEIVPVTGQLVKGANLIKKENEAISVNP